MRLGVKWDRTESTPMKKGSSVGEAMSDTEIATYTEHMENGGHDTGKGLPCEEIESTFGRIPIIGQRHRHFSFDCLITNGRVGWAYCNHDNVQNIRFIE